MSCHTLQSLASPIAPTWCPGCGDFLIFNSLRKAIIDLQLEEKDTVIVYGIGCSGNMADFNRVYGFHGLHGRGLPVAMGIKLANHKLKVIMIGGDGDVYGEGLQHLITAARGNHDLTLIVHNNSRYSLTTGQTSPTSKKGLKTKSTPLGAIEEPLNPLAVALVSKATFVARGYSVQVPQMVELFKQAILHPGFAMVDVLQLCPTFNQEMNHPWYAQRICTLDQTNHNPQDFGQALSKALEPEKLATGIFYQDKTSVAHHAQLPQLQQASLIEQRPTQVNLQPIINSFS